MIIVRHSAYKFADGVDIKFRQNSHLGCLSRRCRFGRRLLIGFKLPVLDCRHTDGSSTCAVSRGCRLISAEGSALRHLVMFLLQARIHQQLQFLLTVPNIFRNCIGRNAASWDLARQSRQQRAGNFSRQLLISEIFKSKSKTTGK